MNLPSVVTMWKSWPWPDRTALGSSLMERSWFIVSGDGALSRFYEDPERPFHPTVPDPGMVRRLAQLIRQQKPDVVHAHSWILHSLLPLLPSSGTRLVVTMHDYGLVCAKTSFVHHDGVCAGPGYVKCVNCSAGQYGALRGTVITTGLSLMHRSHLKVDSYIAVSTPVAQACRSLAAGGEKAIEVIPPFLSDDSFPTEAPARPDFVPASGDYVMFAGALGPHKGVDVLLQAWGGFDPAVPLVLVGIHRQDTPRRFPEGVRVVENVPHDDVLRAWAHCAVAVVPSRWPEPFGLVALEAMAAGRPVVASAVGALPDLLQSGRAGCSSRRAMPQPCDRRSPCCWPTRLAGRSSAKRHENGLPPIPPAPSSPGSRASTTTPSPD